MFARSILSLVVVVCIMTLCTRVKAADHISAPGAEFVDGCASRSRMELQLAQMMSNKASQDTVKAYAQRVAADYEKLNSELLALAQQYDLQLPDGMYPAQSKLADKIAGTDRTELESAYMQATVKAHLAQIAACKEAMTDDKDPPVKAWATQTVPILEEHLRFAKNINQGTATNFVFATDALDEGLMVVKLSQMVAEKGTSPIVKTFAQQMVTDQTKIDDELRSLAEQKRIKLPERIDEDDQAAMDAVSSKEGKEMEQAYTKVMITHLIGSITACENLANNGTDPELKAFAAKTQPKLEDHLRTAMNVRKWFQQPS